MQKRITLLVVIWIGFAPFASAQGGIVLVDSRADDGGDGRSWVTAYKYLQDALTTARNSGGELAEIWIAAGTYQPDRDCAHPEGSGDRTAAFQLIDGVVLRGGFAGNEDPATFNAARRDPAMHPTTLSGDLAGDDGPSFANNGENSFHVVTADGTGPGTILDGFTISGGCAAGRSFGPHNSGGGMYNKNGACPTIVRCIFRINSSEYHGGGMCNDNSNPTLMGCKFLDNLSIEGSGAGMWNYRSEPMLVNCILHHNLTPYAMGGGAIWCQGGGTVLKNCTIVANSSPGVRSAGHIELVSCAVWGNGSQELALTMATVTFSCIKGGYAGQGNIDADPLFVDLAAGDLRLRPGSPCIDAGSNAGVPSGTMTDLDGHPRFMDDPATADCFWAPGACGTGPIADMGAYEYIPLIPGDFDRDGCVDADEFDVLRSCMSGPTILASGGCATADLDQDGDVDQSDFGVFQRCLSGRDRPADPKCSE